MASIAAALAAEGKALNDQYDAAVKAGDDAFAAANYTQAILSYERASDIKSNEPYPREQIKKANAELAKLEGIEKQYERVMRSGDQNLASKDYEKAVEYYDQALNLNQMIQEQLSSETRLRLSLRPSPQDWLLSRRH